MVVQADYLISDRAQLLGYLNLLEKINCAYCAYGNGFTAVAAVILFLISTPRPGANPDLVRFDGAAAALLSGTSQFQNSLMGESER